MKISANQTPSASISTSHHINGIRVRRITGAVGLSLLLLSFSSLLHAQQSVEIGAKAGGNFFKVGGRSMDNKYRVSVSAGGYIDLNYTPKWSIQPELLWNQTLVKTGDGYNQIYGGVSNQLLSLNYVTVPILAVFKPSPEISLLLGPQYGFLLGQTEGTLPNQPDKKVVSKSDLSLVFGAQLNMGKVKLGVRFSEGLNNINAINTTDEWRQYGGQVYLMYEIKNLKLK